VRALSSILAVLGLLHCGGQVGVVGEGDAGGDASEVKTSDAGADCGASGTSDAAGTIGGNLVSTKYAVAVVAGPFTTVLLTSVSNACELLRHDVVPPSATVVSLQLTGIDAGGYYTGWGGTAAIDNAECTWTLYVVPTNTTMTVTSLTPSFIAGSFDFAFEGGDHVMGDFQAPVCGCPVACTNLQGSGGPLSTMGCESPPPGTAGTCGE